MAGGPFKPDFGLSGNSTYFDSRSIDRLGTFVAGSTPRNHLNLSGAVLQLDKVCQRLVRVFALSTLTQSLLVLQRQLRSAGSCSTASLLGVHIALLLPDSDECK